LWRVLPNLDRITEQAVPIYFESERNPSQSNSIVGFHNYLAKVSIDGRDYFLRITAQEIKKSQKNKNLPDQLHSAFISDVEIIEAGIAGVTSKIIDLATIPQTGFDSKLAQFLKDGKSASENTSKVVDENGEPQIQYHSTTAVLTSKVLSSGAPSPLEKLKKTHEPLQLLVIGSYLCVSGKNTGNLCQINRLNLKQCHQKSG
jgi:hypothetical protein